MNRRVWEGSPNGWFVAEFFTAAEVPCETAPFASFSGRTEKDGPARPERVPISSSLVKAIKKVSVMKKFYEIVLMHFDEILYVISDYPHKHYTFIHFKT